VPEEIVFETNIASAEYGVVRGAVAFLLSQRGNNPRA
jgi:hypothetical protein